MNSTDSVSDDELAKHLATRAAEQLQQLRDEVQGTLVSFLDRQFAGDRLSHRYLSAAFAQLRPADKFVSEEGRDDITRLSAERVWIVDPLDGSSDFADERSNTWAVHVGLAINGKPHAGAVAVPMLGNTFSTLEPLELPAEVRRQRPIVVMSRLRVHRDAYWLARYMDAEIYAMGSAGVKAMSVVTGDADAWIHAGNLYEWDSCGPAAVALAAGLHVSHLDGSPILYNRQDLSQSNIFISRLELAADIQKAFANR